MRFINILGAGVVLACAIYVSFTHSIELFRLGGFTDGRLALVGVIMSEVGFIVSALNIVVARLRQEKPGSGAKAGFLLGVSMVLWANIRSGLAAGLTGVIIGSVVPLWLLVAEVVFSQAIMRRREPVEPATANATDTQGQPVAPPVKVEYTPPIVEPEPPKVEYIPPKAEYTPPETPAKLTVVKSTHPTEPPKVSESPAQENELGEVGELALALFRESGRLPTRRSLASAANISEWKARLVIEKLQNSLA